MQDMHLTTNGTFYWTPLISDHGTEMPQSHTWQLLSMCRQKLHMENSLHQKKTHAEWFLTVNAQSILPHANKRFLDMRQNWGKWKGQQSLGIKPRTPGLCNQSSTHRLTSQRRNSEGVVGEWWKWLHFVVDTLRPNTWMKHCIMATGKIFSLERWIYYSLSQPPRLLILW